MIHKDPIHKVLKLIESTRSTTNFNESENINPGNLLIGQTVDVKVTDASGAQFLRPFEVGNFLPDGMILLKDVTTQDIIYLQYRWDANTNGLLYTSITDFGVKYELVIDRNLMSNQSITSLNESVNYVKNKSGEFQDDGVKGTEYIYSDRNGNKLANIEVWEDDGSVYVNDWYDSDILPFNHLSKLKDEYKSIKDFEKDLDRLTK